MKHQNIIKYCRDTLIIARLVHLETTLQYMCACVVVTMIIMAYRSKSLYLEVNTNSVFTDQRHVQATDTHWSESASSVALPHGRSLAPVLLDE